MSLPRAWVELEASGAPGNFRRVAGEAGGFLGEANQDAEVYKWLEAASWEVGRTDDRELLAWLATAVNVVAAAQDRDGYLHTWYQLNPSAQRFGGLRDGGPDETYTAGLLFHAAVAHHRATGGETLLGVATRVADSLEDSLFATSPSAVSGHPGLEMGLVELYRETSNRVYLNRARALVAGRGYQTLGNGRFGASHYMDYAVVAEMPTLTGHAVAALYLACGATDVAMETNDARLLAALERQWESVTERKTYLTGGLGSRHRNEDLGDDYELPSDQAYAETCAAVASVMWSWRLLLATGRRRYADSIERALFNGVLAGESLDGACYFYVNPLQVRDGHRTPAQMAATRRARWFPLACCPPNLMRLLASVEHYAATSSGDDLVLHQLIAGTLRWPGLDATLEIETDYPWAGKVRITHRGVPVPDRLLAVRIPPWARATVRVAGGAKVDAVDVVEVRRNWSAGDEIIIMLDLSPRLTVADPRIDALRGSVAIERGPLVYCVEAVDNGGSVDKLWLDPGARLEEVAGFDGVPVRVVGRGFQVHHEGPGGLPYGSAGSFTTVAKEPAAVTAVPYFAWANRTPGSMRVWLPLLEDQS